MKKFFAIILLELFLFQNIAVAEQVKIDEIGLDYILLYNEFPHPVDNLSVITENLPLTSKLKRKYIATKYTVTSKFDSPVKIKDRNKTWNYDGYIDVSQGVARLKGERRRNLIENYKYSLKGLELLSLLTLMVPMFIAYPPTILIIGFLEDDGSIDYLNPKHIFITPITSTLMAPYNYFNDKREDKKFEQDMNEYANQQQFGIIYPGETIEFIMLRPKKLRR